MLPTHATPTISRSNKQNNETIKCASTGTRIRSYIQECSPFLRSRILRQRGCRGGALGASHLVHFPPGSLPLTHAPEFGSPLAPTSIIFQLYRVTGPPTVTVTIVCAFTSPPRPEEYICVSCLQTAGHGTDKTVEFEEISEKDILLLWQVLDRFSVRKRGFAEAIT